MIYLSIYPSPPYRFYVEQISGNSPYSFKVLNFLILFLLKSRALLHWHLLKKTSKHILLITINSVLNTE